MLYVNFDWDPNKARTNIKEHNVTFEEATLAFEDEFALEEYDNAHSTFDEKRFNRIGQAGNRILYVVYTVLNESAGEAIYRIISARETEKWEREIYEQERFGF
jgi:hypothetical protein